MSHNSGIFWLGMMWGCGILLGIAISLAVLVFVVP
jgi:hypothetical protein